MQETVGHGRLSSRREQFTDLSQRFVDKVCRGEGTEGQSLRIRKAVTWLLVWPGQEQGGDDP